MSLRTRDINRGEARSLMQVNILSALRACTKITFLLICGLFFIAFVILTQAPSSANAVLVELQATPTPNPNLSIGNDTCLDCHGKPDLTMKLDNGDELSLYVDPQEYGSSIHGKDGYACVQCHTTVGNYPHPPFTAADRRDASLKIYPACYRCHSGEYELTQDSVHAAALASGNRQAAICIDCHTAHAVRQLNDAKTGQQLPGTRTWIPQTCAQCHNAIYQEYRTSVHGSALVGEGNPDVPTCIDCHGVHNIANPLTNAFRLNSPELCAKCHTDPKRMAKYGISTAVLNTYVADFHGTTVTIFEKESPDAPTNKPVCFDCHGVHNIARIDDPQRGLLIEQNLLARCKVCHPDATTNFPTAWLSHYIPSPSHNSIVYYVGIFYKLMIPTVLGGMALLVVMDFGRTLLNRYKKSQLTPSSPVKEGEMPIEKAGLQAASQEVFPEPEAPPSSSEGLPSPEGITAPAVDTTQAVGEKQPVGGMVAGEPQPADVIPIDETQVAGDKEAAGEIQTSESPVQNQAEPNPPDESTTPPQTSGEDATDE